MMNILLTGSGGFIGSHLKSYLSYEYNLFCPRSFQLNLMNKSAVQKYFEENNIDYIIHCASTGVRITPDATIEEVVKPNLDMFKNLAEANCPMMTIGSGAEYDKSRSIIKIKEEDFGKSIPKDPYGYSKYMISKEIENRKNILNLRLFGIYGVNEDPSRVTSCIVNAKLRNEPVILNQNVKFSFIYIEDFCKVVKYFVKKPTKEKFINVAQTENIEIVELANLLNIEYKVKNEGLNKEYTADNSLLLKEIGEFKFTSYKDGMNDFFRKFN